VSDFRPRITAFGDAALLASYPERIEPRINEAVHALAGLLRDAHRSGVAWRQPVPAYASVLAPFDPLAMSMADATDALRELAESVTASMSAASASPAIEIPVRYGGADGPDLEDVARRTGLSPAEVIARHTAQPYRAYFLGFAPGFAYLGTLPAELHVPRRDTPRQRVPAGSVAIAGEQTAVYSLPTPGGWHLVGRTDVRLWDVEREPPALIQPGREVRFVASRD
jgi:KipI family sensor histidine kinase inhibitor